MFSRESVSGYTNLVDNHEYEGIMHCAEGTVVAKAIAQGRSINIGGMELTYDKILSRIYGSLEHQKVFEVHIGIGAIFAL